MTRKKNISVETENLPKHEILQRWLHSAILSGDLPPGARLPSEHALAGRFGYSRQTIRHAIGRLQSDGLLERRQGSGTFVTARAGALRRTGRMVAVMTTYSNDYIFPDIIRGIDGVLTGEGCSLSLHITGNRTEREADCLQDILDRPVDGLIVEATKSAFPNPNLALYRQLAERGVPIVFINGFYAGLDAAQVLFDDEEAGRMAAGCLLDAGHKSLGGLFKVDDIQGHRRHAGFLRAHHERGLPVREDRVIWFTTEDLPRIPGPDYDNVFRKRFEGVSGLVCYNDQVAVGVLETLRRLNLTVPGDVSVVGIDDSDLARMTVPKLTTVAHPGALLGRRAAGRLIGLMEGGMLPIHDLMEPVLIQRESVAAHAASIDPGPRGSDRPGTRASTPAGSCALPDASF